MIHRRNVLAALAVAAVLVALGVGFVAGTGTVLANHDADAADFTVEPMSDRSPGATNVEYGQVVVGQADVNFETLETMEAIYDEGSFADCGPADSEVFGIDRGNTHDGYEVDEELQENTKSFTANEDVFRAEFYGEDDFGPSTHLDSGDATVSVADCIDNPDEPGWYQIEGSTSGVTEGGEQRTISAASHYFWICDCEDESEAREELGPPPSEPEPTETPESTESGDDEDGDAGDEGAGDDESSSDTPTEDDQSGDDAAGDETADVDTADGDGDADDSDGDADDSDGDADDESNADDTADLGSAGGSEAGSGDATDAEGQEASWDDHRVQTPTPGDGDGFGGLAALGAILGAALLFYRRE